MGRSEGADPLTLERAETALATQHNLLSRALQILTDPNARAEMTASLDLLLRVIAVVPPSTLAGPEDPWLYFYEDFLAAYDLKLRKDTGAYYTPVEVVRCQVRLIDDMLVNRFGKPLGFADTSVVTLDPATGTGTYLLCVIEHALGRIEAEQGSGAVAGQATTLAENLYGFEQMVGPYAVTELRVSRALRDRGAVLPKDGTHVYLTDTLESPNAKPPQLPLFLHPIAEQHAKALKVKCDVPVIVCLGNPPYDRHKAVEMKDENNLSRYGGWVRFGDPLPGDTIKDKKGKEIKLKSAKARLKRRQRLAILKDFIDPAIAVGYGVHVKNLYNSFVYFWRWAMWKVFEHTTYSGVGIVSFITSAAYLKGQAFCGMREHMRRLCKEIYILDLSGEGRGTRKSDNVFAIQTPVAIAIAVRSGNTNKDKPARARYTRVEGTRDQKLRILDTIVEFKSVQWQDCPKDWHAPFHPAGKGDYFTWPLLTDLMPWQHSGVQLKRTWPIAVNTETLERRWCGLIHASDRSEAFHGTGDREIDGTYRVALTGTFDSTPIANLTENASIPQVQRYAYRSYDRHYIIADGRLISRPRPELWHAHSEQQIYISTTLQRPLDKGPALTCAALIPDLNHFCNRGAKDTVPLYRTADASETNILPGLLDLLSKTFKRKVTPEDFLSYIYGALAQPAFTARFTKELETCELRVPITKDTALFEQVCAAGARLLWLHTFGERFVPKDKQRCRIPRGLAKCTKAVPGHVDGYPEVVEYNDTSRTLRVGEGEFSPVAPEIYKFEVSGFMVVRSWLKHRLKRGTGRKSSPLDDIRPECWTSQFTTELLDLLWVLEATVEGYSEQAKLLEAVVAGVWFQVDELPEVSEEMRKPASARAHDDGLFDLNDGS